MKPIPSGMIRSLGASVDITPTESTILGAGPYPETRSTHVQDKLEANLAIMMCADEDPVILVSVDLLYPGQIIRARLEQTLALPPDRIWLFSSHTHRGPMTDDTKPALGLHDAGYTNDVADRITSVAKDLLERVREAPAAQLSAGSIIADHSINRRQQTSRGIKLAPNPAGDRDETLTLLRSDVSEKDTSFITWNYACHPVAYPEPLSVSAHYPGAVRSSLRERLGQPNLPVLFMQGFSGDTRPAASARAQTLKQRFRDRLTGPRFHDMSWPTYRAWTQDLAQRVHDAESTTTSISVRTLRSRRVVADRSFFVNSDHDLPDVSFQSLEIDEEITMLGVSAEVVGRYAIDLRARHPNLKLMIAGCMDHTIGYFPTELMLREGGYEAGGYCKYFGLTSINANIQSEFCKHMDQVLPAVRSRK